MSSLFYIFFKPLFPFSGICSYTIGYCPILEGKYWFSGEKHIFLDTYNIDCHEASRDKCKQRHMGKLYIMRNGQ